MEPDPIEEIVAAVQPFLNPEHEAMGRTGPFEIRVTPEQRRRLVDATERLKRMVEGAKNRRPADAYPV